MALDFILIYALLACVVNLFACLVISESYNKSYAKTLSIVNIIWLSVCLTGLSFAVKSEIATVEYSQLEINNYKKKLDYFKLELDKIGELNPSALALLNHDTPIATAISSRERILVEMSKTERRAIDSIKSLRSIEMSILSFVLGDYKVPASDSFIYSDFRPVQ
jgi:hypothetical protein